MNNTMNYKGYTGSVEFSETDGVFYCKVMGVRALISYEGEAALFAASHQISLNSFVERAVANELIGRKA